MTDLRFSVSCKCGGSLSFGMNSVSSSKEYICPECLANLGVEVSHFLEEIKNSINQHCKACNNLNNVRTVRINGKLLEQNR